VKTALVLGGGGAKALAHAGAWKALQERGAQITHIIGTSMGAVIGAALAAGSGVDELLRTARSLTAKDFAKARLVTLLKGVFAASLFEPRGLRRTIAQLVPATRFADLKIPLTVTATDFDSGELVFFGADPHPQSPAPQRDLRGEGGRSIMRAAHGVPPLQDALYASCALPLYFPPAVIDGRRLADGGLRAVVPLQGATRLPVDLVVAVDVGPGFDETTPPGVRSPVPALVRAHGDAERIMMAAQTERAIAAWPADAPRLVVVRAVAEREATFAVGQADRYLDAGYGATKQALSRLTPGGVGSD
jgi:NTE family protein